MQEIVDWRDVSNPEKLGDKCEEGHAEKLNVSREHVRRGHSRYNTYAYIGVRMFPTRQDSKSQTLYMGARSWRKEKSCHQPIASRGM